MKFKIYILTLVLSFLPLGSVFAEGAVKTLKIATLAPQGTVTAKELIALKKEIKQKTGGKVDLRIYFGGTAGDEKDVVRKMRIGQMHGAALTGVGLGMVLPEIRVLELPFLFKNYRQADHVYNHMRPHFEKQFDKKGFVLLGWAEVGFVKIFANKPITKKADLAGIKMWMWEGDPLAQAMYEAMNVVPVPLSITDVLTSLKTGLIDGCYAPELGAIAFQWHTAVKYITDVNLVDATGGIVISKKEWAKLAAAEQKIIKEAVASRATQLIAKTRDQNKQSLDVLKSLGIKVVQLTPEALAELQGISAEVQQKLIGKLYSQEILTKVKTLVSQAP